MAAPHSLPRCQTCGCTGPLLEVCRLLLGCWCPPVHGQTEPVGLQTNGALPHGTCSVFTSFTCAS